MQFKLAGVIALLASSMSCFGQLSTYGCGTLNPPTTIYYGYPSIGGMVAVPAPAIDKFRPYGLSYNDSYSEPATPRFQAYGLTYQTPDSTLQYSCEIFTPLEFQPDPSAAQSQSSSIGIGSPPIVHPTSQSKSSLPEGTPDSASTHTTVPLGNVFTIGQANNVITYCTNAGGVSLSESGLVCNFMHRKTFNTDIISAMMGELSYQHSFSLNINDSNYCPDDDVDAFECDITVSIGNAPFIYDNMAINCFRHGHDDEKYYIDCSLDATKSYEYHYFNIPYPINTTISFGSLIATLYGIPPNMADTIAHQSCSIATYPSDTNVRCSVEFSVPQVTTLFYSVNQICTIYSDNGADSSKKLMCTLSGSKEKPKNIVVTETINTTKTTHSVIPTVYSTEAK